MADELRVADTADAPSLAVIDAAVAVHPWTEAQFVEACGDAKGQPRGALVLDYDGETVGFVVYSTVLDEASIYNLAVHSDYQGRGFGQRLLTGALDRMRRIGATRCLLEVRQSNTIARRLYEGADFTLDGVRKNYYPTKGGREDAMLMSLVL
jgi:ribosomal-protein-alanine N-acetyltransferase